MTPAISNPWGSVAEQDAGTLRLHLLPERRGGGWRLFSQHMHRGQRRGEDSAPTATERSSEEPREGAQGEVLTWRRRLQRAVEWIQRRGGAQEKVLRELHEPERVEVIHPARLSEREAREIWRGRLEILVRRHRRWLLVDGSLLPLSALAALVPGPNVWFVYLAWRALAHHRTARGGVRALEELPVRFTPEPGLDQLVELTERRWVLRRKQKIRTLGERLGIEGLEAAY